MYMMQWTFWICLTNLSQQRFSGARHIVGKRDYVPERFKNPQNDADRASAIQAGVLSEDGKPLTRNDIYAMELMSHSSLEDLIKKAARARTQFRNGELWKIFQCRRLNRWYLCYWGWKLTRVSTTVLKSCIALAYPDRWGGGNIQDETIPQGADSRPLPIQNAIIHFDISTDNGKYNSPVVHVHMIELMSFSLYWRF